jgi:hypothetical protein
MDLGVTGLVGMEWISLAQDRYRMMALVKVVMNFVVKGVKVLFLQM